MICEQWCAVSRKRRLQIAPERRLQPSSFVLDRLRSSSFRLSAYPTDLNSSSNSPVNDSVSPAGDQITRSFSMRGEPSSGVPTST